MKMVNDQDGHEILHDDIQTMKDALDRIEIELKKYPFKDAWNYLKPLRHMTYGAWHELTDKRDTRQAGADDIINSVI